MQQATCAEVSFEQYRKPTRRERFLDEMNRVVPWAELAAAIEPVYPKAEGPGRPPVGVERMLRLHCLQQWFNLSDPAVEEALYDSRALRHFVGIDLGREPVPDETTICKFRHLLEAHQVGAQLFARIGEYLAEQGLQVNRGTIVDATIISAPRSTKNRQKERDPEMHQTKKGNQWYFGMKAHIGVDSRTKLIHSVAATAANVHDSQLLPDLLHVPGGHGHAEVDLPTATDDPIDLGQFEYVSDHHLGVSGPQGRRPVILAADHGANRKPASEEQAGHGSPNRPELTGSPVTSTGPLSTMQLPAFSPMPLEIYWKASATFSERETLP